MIKYTRPLAAVIALSLFSVVNASSAAGLSSGDGGRAEDEIEAEFRHPEQKYGPYTWWHWVNGYVSRRGITMDLECMKSIGIAGFTNFYTALDKDNFGGVVHGSDEYYDLIRFVLSESSRLGLRPGFHNCAGWSSTGGPWVRDEDGMKTLIFSETVVRSGQKDVILPMPDEQEFQFAPKDKGTKQGRCYTDLAVIAFPKSASPRQTFANWREKTMSCWKGRSENTFMEDSTEVGAAVVSRADIIDLSGRMSPDGRLDHVFPEGDWTVLRFGYALTGMDNKPSHDAAGRGLEVDKLSRRGLLRHWDRHIRPILEGNPDPDMKVEMTIDSYECGCANWTDGLEDIFRDRMKYDLLDFLPAMAGYVVDDVVVTERVLRDFRTVVSDLMVENYFRTFGRLCHRNNCLYGVEPYGWGTFDAYQAAYSADVPMAECWYPENRGFEKMEKVIGTWKNITGRKIIGAESFTCMNGNWSLAPRDLKRIGDRAFAHGINRLYFHTNTHQALPDSIVAGMCMTRFGTNLDRSNTWYAGSRDWIEYLTRCQYILQEGTRRADVLIVYGEETGYIDWPAAEDVPDTYGHTYDVGGIRALRDLEVSDGHRLRLKVDGKWSENHYEAVVVTENKFMSVEDVEKLCRLSEDGFPVYSDMPLYASSYKDARDQDERIAVLVGKYWKSGKIKTLDAMADDFAKVAPDAEMPSGVLFNHYDLDGRKFYFVSNQSGKPVRAEASFRVSGMTPEIWNPVDASIREAAVWRAERGRTTVSLDMEADESCFVVFRTPARCAGRRMEEKVVRTLDLSSDWRTEFESRNGNCTYDFHELVSWDRIDDGRIRHFSGTASYFRQFSLKRIHGLYRLDLGDVEVWAEVFVNGKRVAALWTRPYSVDVTSYLKKGGNTIEVKVTNLLVNAIAGAINEGTQSDFVSRYYKTGQGKPLRGVYAPSGLLGPVRIENYVCQ